MTVLMQKNELNISFALGAASTRRGKQTASISEAFMVAKKTIIQTQKRN